MFARVCLCLGAALAAAAVVAGSAGAATVGPPTLLPFNDSSQIDAARQALADYLDGKVVLSRQVETFEEFDAWKAPGDPGTSNPQTNVGRFTGFGDPGTGAAAIKGGTAAEVRGDDSMSWGRYNTDTDNLPGLIGGNWLDSNDMPGLRWEIDGLGQFNTLAFFVNDAADVGARFSMNIGGQSFADLAGASGRLANSNLMLVLIELSEAVDSLTVEFLNDRRNDGFGFDGAIVANIAQAPLPPAAALLLAGLAGLAGVRRRAA